MTTSSSSSMSTGKLLVVVAACVAAAAAALSMDSRGGGDVVLRVLELRAGGGGGGRVELIPVPDGAAGPESLAFDGDGEGPYTGVSDGRILRWRRDERRWVEHSPSPATAPELAKECRGSRDLGREHECGRPLGLRFNTKTHELIIADAYLGLRVVSPKDNVSRPLLPEWPGTRFSFANGVEIDHETGAIYFTETSTRFQRREFLNIVISGDDTGRLLKYDPASNRVEVLADSLSFPNGLAMSDDGSHLLLAETTTGKILRYWLRPPPPPAPPRALLEEVARVAGFPDNIRRSPRGGFWVGLHARRGRLAGACVSRPWFRRLVLQRLPARRVQWITSLLNRLARRQVVALRLMSGGDGKVEVVEAVSVRGGIAREALESVSEVEERNGTLWIGSVLSPFLGVLRL